MMELIFLVFAWTGTVVFFLRIRKLMTSHSHDVEVEATSLKELSIVVPARNEETNLPQFLRSLEPSIANGLSVIVVDDRSSDRTAEIAENAHVKLIRNRSEPPEGWSGKNWACLLGAQENERPYLLFTDADTQHSALGLSKAMHWHKNERAALSSALPFHLCPTFWERAVAGFHALVYVAADPFHATGRSWPYAIGQFMLFDSEIYRKHNGHSSVFEAFAEDLAFAKLFARKAEKVSTCEYHRVFDVRMYENFGDFVKGWRRILRWGMTHSNFRSFFEVSALIFSFSTLWKFENPIAFSSGCLSLLFLIFFLRKMGQFSAVWSIVFLPLSLLLFVALSVLAGMDVLFKRNHSWRGRVYKANQF